MIWRLGRSVTPNVGGSLQICSWLACWQALVLPIVGPGFWHTSPCFLDKDAHSVLVVVQYAIRLLELSDNFNSDACVRFLKLVSSLAKDVSSFPSHPAATGDDDGFVELPLVEIPPPHTHTPQMYLPKFPLSFSSPSPFCSLLNTTVFHPPFLNNQQREKVYLKIGMLLASTGDLVGAVRHFEAHLPLSPFDGNSLFHGYCGLYSFQLWQSERQSPLAPSRLDTAIKCLRASLDIGNDPTFATCLAEAITASQGVKAAATFLKERSKLLADDPAAVG